jgi:hypothetical protein
MSADYCRLLIDRWIDRLIDGWIKVKVFARGILILATFVTILSSASTWRNRAQARTLMDGWID